MITFGSPLSQALFKVLVELTEEEKIIMKKRRNKKMKMFAIAEYNEPFLRPRDLILVETEEQAKAILETDPDNLYCTELETLSDEDIKDWVCDTRLRNVGNPNKLFKKYCKDCTLKYNEDCPHIIKKNKMIQ